MQMEISTDQMDGEIMADEVLKKQDVIDFIDNYYTAPPCSRELLLDNIILGIKCMSSKEGGLNNE